MSAKRSNTPPRGFLLSIRRSLVVQKSLINLDIPEYAVPNENLVPVNDYPSHMQNIPPSRMFTIKLALDKYKEKAGQDTPVYDASQGDGGESLPGVPRELLERAL